MLGGTCTKYSEWSWIIGMGILFLLVPIGILFLLRQLTRSAQHLNRKQEWPREGSVWRPWTLFLLVNIFWFVAALYQSLYNIYQEESTLSRYLEVLGAKAAWPSYWNLLFVLVPVQRISSLRHLLTLSNSSSSLSFSSNIEMIPYHIWAGYAIVFWLSVHTVLLSIVYAINNTWSKWWEKMLPFRNFYTEGVVNGMGWVGYIFLILLTLSSLPSIRHKYHEVFFVLHLIFSFLFILFGNLHDYNTLQFGLPALMTLITERLLRRYHSSIVTRLDPKQILLNTSAGQVTDVLERNLHETLCTATIMDQRENQGASILALTFNFPSTWDTIPKPGMFVYLKSPSISKWQSHPFTISAIDAQNQTFSLHIKALGDWTYQLIQLYQQIEKHHIETSLLPSIQLDIQGPYGDESDLEARLDSYPQCLFIVGGIGLTSISEALYRRSRQMSSNRSYNRHSTLIWIVRTTQEMEFLTQDLLLRLQSLSNPNAIDIKIFVTSSSSSISSSNTIQMQKDYDKKIFKCFFGSPYFSFMNPPFVTGCASMIGVTLSFLFARLICCNQLGIDNDGNHYHACSLFGKTVSTCVSCDVDDILAQEQQQQQEDGNVSYLPCCTVEVCYFCFRGVTVLLTFFLAPIIALGLLHFIAFLQYVWNLFMSPSRGFLYKSELQLTDKNSSNNIVILDELNENNDVSYNALERLNLNDNRIQVEYERPDLKKLLQVFKDSPLDEISDFYSNNSAAVIVCGSAPLVLSASKEVRRIQQQDKHDVNLEAEKNIDLVVLNPP